MFTEGFVEVWLKGPYSGGGRGPTEGAHPSTMEIMVCLLERVKGLLLSGSGVPESTRMVFLCFDIYIYLELDIS